MNKWTHRAFSARATVASRLSFTDTSLAHTCTRSRLKVAIHVVIILFSFLCSVNLFSGLNLVHYVPSLIDNWCSARLDIITQRGSQQHWSTERVRQLLLSFISDAAAAEFIWTESEMLAVTRWAALIRVLISTCKGIWV